MRTLFGKIFLWFVGTAALTIVALSVAAAMRSNSGPARNQPPLGAMIGLGFAEARIAYEQGGPEALRATLRRFREVTECEGVLTDANGRDLVTGRDRSDLAAIARTRPPRRPPPTFELPFLQPRPVILRRSPDGQYSFFVILQRGRFISWFLQPEMHLAILVLVALLCYAFARYLTVPVRDLQKAVQQFGQGNLSARAESRRKDELGQLARTFNQMADRIVTLLSAERRLLLDISHEIRSPLARLSVAVELARSGDDYEKHLTRIQREADRLNALVGGLLQVTRAEGDTARMRSERVALDQLLQEVASDVTIEAEQKNCRFDLRLSPAEVPGDSELIRRAFENVIRNAVRYAPEDTAIEICMEKRPNKVAVTIRDFGPGVPDEHRERIFDPFYRVDTDRDRLSGGAGLGLSIARRAVELHGGTISAENVNPGLKVKIELQHSP